MKLSATHEPASVSCRSLIWLLENETDARKREVYLLDLVQKSIPLNGEGRSEALMRGFSTVLPARVQEILSQTMEKQMTPVKDIDVAIVTLKKPELLGAKVAFGVLDSASPRLERGYHLFEGEFNDDRYRHSKYSYVLTVASDDRNVACSNCVNAVLSLYRPKVCILIGMAAGNRAKVALGDVVVAETVIDTAGGRAEVGGVIPRPEHFNIYQSTKSQLTNYEESWSANFRSVVDNLKVHRAAPASMSESWVPNFKQGNILADEKLIADGSMEQRRLQVHDQAIALDMESSGFAQACIAQAIPWLIFRGISDYGDPESKDGAVPNDPNRKNWQPFASLAAAHIARNFLATRYRTDVF